MRVIVEHIVPVGNGDINIVMTEADTDAPEWKFNLPECKACQCGNCLQTTIVSKNYLYTMIVHGLTAGPIVMVKLPMPEGLTPGEIRDDIVKIQGE